MIEFIEQHIFWILALCVGGYIAFDLFKSRKEISKERAESSFKNFLKILGEVSFKQYLFAFVCFLMMFLLIRGFYLAQNEAQECEVWLTQENLRYVRISDEMTNYLNGFNNLEQNRSYNYYLRWFNANGGRLENVVNVKCNFKLDLKRFIKNVKLDYKERGFIYG